MTTSRPSRIDLSPISVALILTILFAPFSPLRAQAPLDRKTQHIIFVMTDGLRWQEVFRGAEESLMNRQNGKVKNEAALKKTYWRDSAEERREVLMPFVWQVMAKQGQIFGNRDKGSDAFVTNHMFFSYPGYSETLCGFPDDTHIHSNDNVPNPNVTVLEWLKNRPNFQGDIATFGADFNITYPLLFDSGDKINEAYGVTAIPTTYFIDSKGIVRSVFVQPLTSSTLQQGLSSVGIVLHP